MPSPNIILITADHLRWDCLGLAGNADVKTPNIDALAAHGVRFDQATTVSTSGAGARASLLTGLMPTEHGVHQGGANPPKGAQCLPALLARRRYHTAFVGKLDLNADPASLGFHAALRVEQRAGLRDDDYHRWLTAEGVSDRIDRWDQVDRETAPKAYWRSFGAMRSNLPEARHSTSWIGSQAVRHIQRVEGPFFLWVSFVKPGHPFDPPSPWAEMYAPGALKLPAGFSLPVPEEDAAYESHFRPRDMTEARFRRVLAHYYANISHVDHQIGRILATLTSRGITNNLVIFCATHGDCMGQHGLVIKGSGRPYEALLRVPLVVSGFTGQRRGATDPALAQLNDVPATIIEAAGAEFPALFSGRSLLPQLRRPHVAHRDVARADAEPDQQVARTARTKIVESGEPGRCALYDLAKDPHETTNLYHRSAAVDLLQQMRGHIRGWT